GCATMLMPTTTATSAGRAAIWAPIAVCPTMRLAGTSRRTSTSIKKKTASCLLWLLASSLKSKLRSGAFINRPSNVRLWIRGICAKTTSAPNGSGREADVILGEIRLFPLHGVPGRDVLAVTLAQTDEQLGTCNLEEARALIAMALPDGSATL